ncbi:hypothetical protein [Roseomonas xinghualingensis]|uniref:hypothetical protein n=1 Tax=Roseomonas xinghualingensis TaxID=2986475 RepID=UPI0021F14FC1|nr:hypothetical protein [Roseomonas sp. SXEYE001]MCV4205887.1 hypothetical protein [Roseomonas sp. SXEYE001]
MRVPLPGRDYFPPRVLLRGAARSAIEGIRAEPRLVEPRGGLPALRPGPASMPAMPPSPMMGVRPGVA